MIDKYTYCNDNDIILKIIKEKNVALLNPIIKNYEINAVDENGISLLFHAIQYSNFDIVKILIENGAEINIRNVSKITPLMVAADIGNIDMVNLLVEKGADTNIVDQNNNYAYNYAENNNYYEIVRVLKSKTNIVCSKCSKNIPAESIFCLSCGYKINNNSDIQINSSNNEKENLKSSKIDKPRSENNNVLGNSKKRFLQSQKDFDYNTHNDPDAKTTRSFLLILLLILIAIFLLQSTLDYKTNSSNNNVSNTPVSQPANKNNNSISYDNKNTYNDNGYSGKEIQQMIDNVSKGDEKMKKTLEDATRAFGQ